MRKLLRFAAGHKRLTGSTIVLGIGLLIFVLIWFQPQKLFIDTSVAERLPSARPDGERPAAKGTAPKETAPKGIASGSFRALAHRATGTATIFRLADGSYVLRLEDLDTENGPDLRVYLSEATASAQGREFAEDFVDLGALKGNRGDQNYEIPGGVDVSRFRSAVIWCRRFTVGFGVAPLE